MKKLNFLFFFLVCYFTSQHLFAAQYPEIDEILASDTAPDGIVFEVISWDKKTWTWAAPLLKELREKLLQKFPGLDVAVVSHGAEQFQLTKKEAPAQPLAIKTLQGLSDQGVNIYVCGTHSSWQDISTDSYIDIIDVSPSGPAQINDYIKLGYTKILLRKPQN